MLKKISLLMLILIAILSSCSMEKRLYRSGYNLQWKHLAQNPTFKQEALDNCNENNDESYKISSTDSVQEIDNASMATTNNSILLSDTRAGSLLKHENRKKQDQINILPFLTECDIIVLRNGDEIKAKIIEIGINEIKYKKCEHEQGPVYVVSKDKVFMIKYSDGNKDVFETTSKESTKDYEQKPTVKQLDNSDKCKQGEVDAKKYHDSTGWFFAGLFFLLLGVIVAAISEPSPHTPSESAYDPVYRDCYRRIAKKNNIVSALAGWVISIIILTGILLSRSNK